MNNFNSLFIDNNQVRIHVLEYISNSNRSPLLIIPGLVNSAEEVASLLEPFLARHTIIISLRGRGLSDSPELGYSLDDQASDIISAIDQIGLNSFSIFGHSVGSTIGIRAMSKLGSRVHSFIIGDFAPFYPPIDRNWTDHMLKQSDRKISDKAILGLAKDGKYIDVSEDLLNSHSRLLLLKGETEFSALRDKEVSKLKELVPAMQIIGIPGCGHEIIMEDPSGTMEAINSFLDSEVTL